MGNSMNGCLRAAGMAENMPPRDMLDMPDEIDFPTDDGDEVAEVPDLPNAQELPGGIASAADTTVGKAEKEPPRVVAAETYSPLGPTEHRTLLVLNGPSGVGKGTLINKLREEYPQKFAFSVSHTTREPRKGEVNGKDYHFVTHEQMEALIAANEFFEYARVHGNIYGTSKSAVQSVTQTEKTCILDIDVQGAQNVRRSAVAGDALYVFIKAPSMEVLEARLRGRGTETEEKVLERLGAAKAEMDFADTPGFYHQIIVNDNLEVAYQGLCATLGLASDAMDDAIAAQEEAPEEAQDAASPVSPGAEPAWAEPGSPGSQNNINDFVPEDDAPPLDDDEIVRQAELRATEATAREREMRHSRENAEQEEMAAQAAAQAAAIAAAIAEATANMQGALAAQEAEQHVEEEKHDEVPPTEAAGVVLEEHHEEHHEDHKHHEVEVDALTEFLNGLHSEGYFDDEELFQIMDDICDAPSPEESQAGKAFTVFHNNPKMFVRKVRSFLDKGGKKAD